MDGERKRERERNKETNWDGDEGAFLPHSPRLLACSMIGPTFLSGVHSLLTAFSLAAEAFFVAAHLAFVTSRDAPLTVSQKEGQLF